MAAGTKLDLAGDPAPKLRVGPQALDTAERVRLIGQGLLNIGAPVLSGLVGIVLVPVMLNGLRAELYGVWVIIGTVVGRCGAIVDLGISWSVIREVSAFVTDEDTDGATERLVSAAANFYLALALAGAAVIAVLGLATDRFMEVSPHAREILPSVFALAAAGFVANQMLSFQIVVLQGLRRFDLSNLLSLSSALLNGISIILIILLGGGLLGVVEAQAASSALCAVAGYKLVVNLQPRFRQRLGRLDWASLRPRMRFSLGSQLISLLSGFAWEGGALLIAFVLGPVAVTSYHIGRKFPAAVGGLVWPFAVVMFPAASEHQRAGDLARAGEALEAGVEWLALLTIPLCVVLWIVAPNLLLAWLGRVPYDAVPIFRLFTAAVLADAVCMAAVGVLLGRGAIDRLLAIVFVRAVFVLGLTVWLLTLMGVRGAAWALFLATPFSSAAVLHVAAGSCGVSLYHLLRGMWNRVWLPTVACAAATLLAMQAGLPGRWLGVMLAAFAGTVAYTIAVYLRGAREEERILARQGLDVLRLIAAQSLFVLNALPGRLGFRARPGSGSAGK